MKIKCQLIVGTSRSTECICCIGKFNGEKARKRPPDYRHRHCQSRNLQTVHREALLSDKNNCPESFTSAAAASGSNGESTNYQRRRRRARKWDRPVRIVRAVAEEKMMMRERERCTEQHLNLTWAVQEPVRHFTVTFVNCAENDDVDEDNKKKRKTKTTVHECSLNWRGWCSLTVKTALQWKGASTVHTNTLIDDYQARWGARKREKESIDKHVMLELQVVD